MTGYISALATRWNMLLGEFPAALRTSGYIYDAAAVLRNYARLVVEFPGCRVLVSVKANPHAELVERLAAVGADFDVASQAELQLVRAHSGAGSVSAVGPGKPDSFIAACVVDTIQVFVAESRRDLEVLAKTVDSARLVAPRVLLRVNPSGATTAANEIMGGKPSQFGIDEEEIPALVEFCQEVMPGALAGYHYFLGSQIRSAGGVIANIDEIDCSLQRLRSTGFVPTALNVGGGFGIPHSDDDPEVLLSEVWERIKLLRETLERSGEDIELMMEAGRYVYGDAGVYVTHVVDIKVSKGIHYVIVDNGISGFTRPALLWGEAHPIWKLGTMPAVGNTVCTVVGPTCLPGDVIAEGVLLSDPAPGDTLIVGCAGAYGYTMSMHAWGSVGTPSETVIGEP